MTDLEETKKLRENLLVTGVGAKSSMRVAMNAYGEHMRHKGRRDVIELLKTHLEGRKALCGSVEADDTLEFLNILECVGIADESFY